MKSVPEIRMHLVPALTSVEMAAVDRAAVEDYGIELLQMMENAGRALATLARDRFLDGDPQGETIVVLAGPGGNGGGAMVAARRLHGWGATVRTVLAQEPDRFAPVPAQQLALLHRLGVEVISSDELMATPEGPSPDLIIDGVIGYSLQGAPHGGAETLIRWAGSAGAPILALDVPSGMEATSGDVHEPTVPATATLTLALPKAGLISSQAGTHVGELYLADIGIPRQLYTEIHLPDPGPLFAKGDVVRLAR
jgi:NAD(P)H-hydrate epimerase